jgi:citrate synthase
VPEQAAGSSHLRTEIASHDLHHIYVRGYDLTADLIGKMSFTDVAFLLIAHRIPQDEERRVLDAVLVSLMEHGLTLSALAARTTYWVEPGSLQGAVAAGLLGAGSRVLGSMEECGKILTRIDAAVSAGSASGDAADAIVAEYREASRRLPGIGHAIHTEGDPRAERLFEVAQECGYSGRHVAAIKDLAAAVEQATGRWLPINATGAIAAILLELGVPWRLHKGFALISRTAGLIAHVSEEAEAPVTPILRQVILDSQ